METKVAKDKGTSTQVSDTTPTDTTSDKMGVEAFCVITGQQALVGKLMLVHISAKGDTETQKTQAEWEKIRDEVMNTAVK